MSEDEATSSLVVEGEDTSKEQSREQVLAEKINNVLVQYENNVDNQFVGSKTTVLAKAKQILGTLQSIAAEYEQVRKSPKLAELKEKSDALHRQFNEKLQRYLDEQKEKLKLKINAIQEVLLQLTNLPALQSKLAEYAQDEDESIGVKFQSYSELVQSIAGKIESLAAPNQLQNLDENQLFNQLQSIQEPLLKAHCVNLLLDQVKVRLEASMVDSVIAQCSQSVDLSGLMDVLTSHQGSPIVASILAAIASAKQSFDSEQNKSFTLFGFNDGKQATIKAIAEPLIAKYVQEVGEQRRQEREHEIDQLKKTILEQLSERASADISSSAEELAETGFFQQEQVEQATEVLRKKVMKTIAQEVDSADFSTISKTKMAYDIDFVTEDEIGSYLLQPSRGEKLSQELRALVKKCNNIISSESYTLDLLSSSLKPKYRTGKLELISSAALIKNNGKETNEQVEERQLKHLTSKYIDVLTKRMLAQLDDSNSFLQVAKKIGLEKSAYLDISACKDVPEQTFIAAQQQAVDYLSEVFGFSRENVQKELGDLVIPDGLTSVGQLTEVMLTNQNGEVELLDPKIASDEYKGPRQLTVPEEIWPFGRQFSREELSKKKEIVANFLAESKLTIKLIDYLTDHLPNGFTLRADSSDMFPHNQFYDMRIRIDVKSLLSQEEMGSIQESVAESSHEDTVKELIVNKIKESGILKSRIQEINNFVQEMTRNIITDPDQFLQKIGIDPKEKSLSSYDWFKLIIIFVKGKFETLDIESVTDGLNFPPESIQKSTLIQIARAVRNSGQ